MTLLAYQISFISPAGQVTPTNSLGLDILIYIVMAVGFITLGFLVSNFFNKAQLKAKEAEIEAEKERLGRRINALEKEVKHLYSKDDEQAVIINDLKKQLQKTNPPPNPPRNLSDERKKKPDTGPADDPDK